MKIFITGNPGIGKTTVIKKVIEKLGKGVIGFYTEEIRKEGKRIGFEMVEIPSNTRYLFASTQKIGNVRFGKYYLNLKPLERVIKEIEKEEGRENIIIIDEIGRMEFFSRKFRDFIKNLLNSNKTLVATLHRSYKKEFGKYGKIFEVTKENRDFLPERIVEILTKGGMQGGKVNKV